MHVSITKHVVEISQQNARQIQMCANQNSGSIKCLTTDTLLRSTLSYYVNYGNIHGKFLEGEKFGEWHTIRQIFLTNTVE